MENEIILQSGNTFFPPGQMMEMFWWGLASILIVSIGISVSLSVIKEIVRFIRPLPDKIERFMLRLLGIFLGVLTLSLSQFYPFDSMPLAINIFLGMIAGAHSELVYRWFLKAVETWLKKKLIHHEDNQ